MYICVCAVSSLRPMGSFRRVAGIKCSTVSLPGELSIIGFDNMNFARHTYPKLTTIDNPVNLMGHMAAKLVLKNVYQHKNLSITHFFEPSLIIRDSVITNN